ncbi:hypothetical protein MKX41_10435 [Paenibacillus sp. FSL R5-0475]|uniref:hypothetical protein n=1 Tax=Paenibacillus sp. FSL R5-0475 TaxID=2921643 RepID=UPI0030FC55E2
MKKSKKVKLQEHCIIRLQYSYSDGGIAGYNECNPFLCDTIPDLVKYLSLEGIERLKEKGVADDK